MSTATLPPPVAAARAAGLRYVSDAKPGIERKRAGKHFRYMGLDGQPIRDTAELARIRGLAIPPAWTAVWICPHPRGHLQATGRDARGRKQYRYHPLWRAVRDESKYGRLLAFGAALPAIRQQVAADLARPGLPREKVLATLVRLLDTTHIRIGNEEYAQANGSYGLTTLRPDHVAVQGSTLRFQFRGKSGKEHQITVRDRRVAAIVRRCQELPGQELFGYLDADGQPQTIQSDDVNAYLAAISGGDFTAKDFRTWAGTVLALAALAAAAPGDTISGRKHALAAAIRQTAAALGNTPAVCRKAYIHPAVLDRYLDGTLGDLLVAGDDAPPVGLSAEEARLLAFLTTQMESK